MKPSYRESLTNAVATGSCAMRYNTEYGYGKHYYNADQLADRINLIDGMIKEL